MTLVTVDEARALIKTQLDDLQLQTMIDRLEAFIVSKVGLPQTVAEDVEFTETFHGGTRHLYLARKILSIVTITSDGTSITADEYRLWENEGIIERINGTWGTKIVVVYCPTNDAPLRKQVTIDALRIWIERTSSVSERLGDFSYNAPDWDIEVRKILRKLSFTII